MSEGTFEAMRAIYATSYGTPDNLIFGDFPKPKVGPGEILIAVKAAGSGMRCLMYQEWKSRARSRN